MAIGLHHPAQHVHLCFHVLNHVVNLVDLLLHGLALLALKAIDEIGVQSPVQVW